MAYHQRDYARDCKRAWQEAKPKFKNGFASPLRAVFGKKTSYVKELGRWLLMIAWVPVLTSKLAFFSIRRVLKR